MLLRKYSFTNQCQTPGSKRQVSCSHGLRPDTAQMTRSQAQLGQRTPNQTEATKMSFHALIFFSYILASSFYFHCQYKLLAKFILSKSIIVVYSNQNLQLCKVEALTGAGGVLVEGGSGPPSMLL